MLREGRKWLEGGGRSEEGGREEVVGGKGKKLNGTLEGRGGREGVRMEGGREGGRERRREGGRERRREGGRERETEGGITNCSQLYQLYNCTCIISD